jgi:uncharacterized membrane protein YfcA
MLPFWTLIVLFITATLASMVSAVVGMAGGIILLSIMTLFLELSVVVPLHGVVQLASNSVRTLSLSQHIKKPIFFYSLVGMPVGTFLSVQLIQSIENREIFYFLIAALIFYVLFKPKKLPALMIPLWGFVPLSFVAGILNPLIGATGPMLAPFFLRDDLKKEEIIATKAAVQMFGHLIKIPAFLFLGFDYQSYWVVTLLMIVGVILGTRYGIYFLKRIEEKSFRLIFRIALFFAALRILYKATMSFI